MKTLFKIAIIALVVVSAGCKKDKDDPKPAASSCIDKQNLAAAGEMKWVNSPDAARISFIAGDTMKIHYTQFNNVYKYKVEYRSGYDSIYVYKSGTGNAPTKYKAQTTACDTLVMTSASDSFKLAK